MEHLTGVYGEVWLHLLREEALKEQKRRKLGK